MWLEFNFLFLFSCSFLFCLLIKFPVFKPVVVVGLHLQCLQRNTAAMLDIQTYRWFGWIFPRTLYVYIHLKSESASTKSIILPPFCATSVLERVKSYLFVENISLDYIRKENESITFVQPNLEGYQDWRRIIEFGSYLHTLFCTGSTSLTKINE